MSDEAPIAKKEEPSATQDLEKEAEEANMPEPPDGGLRAWLCVLGGFLVLFTTFGYVNSFGVYEDWYLGYLNESSSNIAWVGSFQAYLMLSMGPFAGYLFNEGYFHYLLAIGTVLYTLGYFMVSISTKFYAVFLSQGLTVGVGLGIMFLPTLSVMMHHFKRKRAFVTGIVVSGGSIGGVVFPVMLNRLFYGSTGFGWTVRATAFMSLGMLIAANLLMTTRLPPRKKRPASMQQKPNFRLILKDVPFMLVVFAALFGYLGLFFPIYYLQVFARYHGVNENIAFYSLSILNAASTFGRILPGYIADHIGPINTMIPSLLISAALCWVMLACTKAAGIILIAIFYGFWSGAFLSLTPPIVAQFATNPGEIPARMAITFVITAFGPLLGAPIQGAILGKDKSNLHWVAGASFAGAMMLTGATLVTIAHYLASRRFKRQRL